MFRKIYGLGLIISISFPNIIFSQVVFWSENFNNGCSSNCNASSYTGLNGAWTVTNTGTNGNVANAFFVSCAENGQPVGSCGAGCGNDATLHVGNVPCTFCFVCPAGDCGATYNAGPVLAGEDPATNKRAESPLISTLGKSSIMLSFKYMERGEGTTDDATIEYSMNGGTNWTFLTNPPKTLTTCAGGQGLWTSFSCLLPPDCDNTANLKIGFRWINNSNNGNDPSFAVDNMELSTSVISPPVADFNTSLTSFCDSTCIGFTDQSQNAPVTWNWFFPGATPSSFSGQSPSNICYNIPGNYDVTLIVSNAAGSDTIHKSNYITVNSCFLPQVSFSATDTLFCEKSCIDFTDLSTNNPTNWQWSFPGAIPDTSTLKNPVNICYNAYGAYSIKLVATNSSGSDSAIYTSYIQVNQNPASPVVTLSGGNILSSTPASSYQWYFNSLPLAGETNQVHLAQFSGDYFVIITDSNGCQASSSVTFVGFQGIGNTNYLSPVSFFPNPVENLLYFSMKDLKNTNIQFSVYDLTGRNIMRLELTVMEGPEKYQVELSELENGVYLIEVMYDQDRFIKKIIKSMQSN